MKKRERKILKKIFENTAELTRRYEISPEKATPFLIKTAASLGLIGKKKAKNYLSMLPDKSPD